MEREYIGRYRVIDQIGEGGMGMVLRASDEVRKREVAIKVPSQLDPRVIHRLQQECDVLSHLQHHHIVQVFGSGSDAGLPFYIVMEYVDGVTVEQLLQQQPEHRLEARRALKIAQGVAEALAYAHRSKQRIVHRDIKPANILIRRSDDEVKVTDFGIAAVLAEGSGNTVVGTMAYMAPEQSAGSGVDERADLYSLGALLYEMLTGQSPPPLASVPATPPSQVPGVTLPEEMRERVDRLTLGLLKRDPRLRSPGRAAAVAEEIQALLDGRPSPLKQVGKVADVPVSPPTEQASMLIHEPVAPELLPRLERPPAPRPAPPPPQVAVPAARVQSVPVVVVGRVVPAAPPVRASGKALASLLLGIFGLLFSCVFGGLNLLLKLHTLGAIIIAMAALSGLFSVVLGHIAQVQIRRSAGRLIGSGQAVFGFVLGYACLGLALLVYLAFSR